LSDEEGIEYFQAGNEFYEYGDMQEAIHYYRLAIASFEEIGDVKGLADALLEMGNAYYQLNNYFQANRHYQKALEYYSEMEDLIGEGYALTGLGIVQEKNGWLEDARIFYGRSLQKFKEVKDYEREDAVLTLMAGTYEARGGLEEIMEEPPPTPVAAEVYEEVEPAEDQYYTEKVTTMVEHKRSELTSTSKYVLILIVYLLALIMAELLTTYINKTWGLTLDFIILLALLVNSSVVDSDNLSNLLRSMMVLPIIRIVGLSVPILQIEPLYWYPIIAVPLFIAAYAIMRVQRLSISRVGLVWGNIPIQVLIAVTGLFTGIVEYFILKPAPIIVQFTPLLVIGGGFILILSTGFAEELLFRGIIQNNANRAIGPGFALLYTSLIFATMHMGWLSPIDWIFVFFVGLFYGYCFMKTESIFGISIAHGLSNTILFLIMPFVNLVVLGAALLHL